MPEAEWTRIGLSVIAQVTAVVLLAGLVAGTSLRRHAAARHTLWFGALVWTLASPAIAAAIDRAGFSFRVPRFGFPVTVTEVAPQAVAPLEPVPGGGGARDSIAPASPAPAVAKAPMAARPGVPIRHAIPRVLALIWASGAVVGLVRMAAGWIRIRAMTRAAQPLDTNRHGATLAQVKDALGSAELPPLLTAPALAGPVATGALRPCVVLPEGLADALSTAALRDVLIHEFAHLLRRDPWVGLLQRLAAALYWPHPLVHYLNAQLARAREEVCDNFVIRGGNACDYARTLLALSEVRHGPGVCLAGFGLSGVRWNLADRIAGLLDPRRVSMTQATVRSKLAVAAALAATGLLVASVRVGGALRADEQKPVAPASSEPDAGTVWSIQGVVVDEQGAPLAGVVVRLPRSMSKRGVEGGTTAVDGTFRLSLGGAHPSVNGLVVEVDGGARVGVAGFQRASYFQAPPPVRIVVKPTSPLIVRVKDAAGAPVSSAAVAAVGPQYHTGATTGPEGTATLRIPTDAPIYWVTGRKSGAGFDYFENYRAWPVTGASPLPGEVSLTLDGALTVRIHAVDSKSRPMAGVRYAPGSLQKPGKVFLFPQGYDPLGWVATDAQGIAVFDWLPSSIAMVRFSVEGIYSPENVRYRVGEPPDLTDRLLRPTRLSGTVRLPDGRPARGILVRAHWSQSNSIRTGAMVRTSADGTYALDLPSEELYMVAVQDDNWAAPSHTEIVLHENEPRAGLDFNLGKGTLVRGQVTEGADGKPAARANVELVESGPVLPKEFRHGSIHHELRRFTTTDADGHYLFRVVPGRYMLRTLDTWPSGSEIDVPDAAEVVRDLRLRGSTSPGLVSGIVVAQTPAGERPAPGLRILGLTVGQYNGISRIRSDDAGRFQARRVSGEKMVLYAWGTPPALPGLAGFTEVPEDAQEVKIVLRPTVVVRSRVIDAAGKPQPNKSVRIQISFGPEMARSAHFVLFARTDAEGRFRYGYPPGTRGEFSFDHEKDGKPTGARTAVSFEVPILEPVEVTDLIVPTS
jgi:beta-lactamase regulating signal transducer with metallopeptidase domain